MNDFREFFVFGEKPARQSMHAKGFLGHIAFRVDIDVEGAAGRDQIADFDRADFDDAMPLGWIETRGLGVEHDFPHQLFCASLACNVFNMACTSPRAASSPASV